MGAEFTVLAVRDIIKNPVYCVADQDAYRYFIENNGSVYGDESEFDGVHGVAVYNRTKQTKEASDDSTFLRLSLPVSFEQKTLQNGSLLLGNMKALSKERIGLQLRN